MNLIQLQTVIKHINKGNNVYITTGSVKKARKLAKLLDRTLQPYNDEVLVFVLCTFESMMPVETNIVIIMPNVATSYDKEFHMEIL